MFEMVEGDAQALLEPDMDPRTAFSVVPHNQVLVHSLSGLHMRLLVRKKVEYRGQDLLLVHFQHSGCSLTMLRVAM
jgi:hypothetical protein